MKEATLKVYQGKKKVLILMKADFCLWCLVALCHLAVWGPTYWPCRFIVEGEIDELNLAKESPGNWLTNFSWICALAVWLVIP